MAILYASLPLRAPPISLIHFYLRRRIRVVRVALCLYEFGFVWNNRTTDTLFSH
jgi:hypothetical protein